MKAPPNHTPKNKNIIFTGSAFFLINQIIELLVIAAKNASYENLCGWDCGWYSGMVEHWYDNQPHDHPKGDAANWAFFPAFPLLAKVLYTLGLPPSLSAVMTGKFLFLLATIYFIKFGLAYSSKAKATHLAAAATLNPYALYGSTGYSEPLFLLLSCIFFLNLKSNAPIRTGISAALLSATRLVGICAFLICIAYSLKEGSKNKDKHPIVLGTLIAPLGLALFMLYLYFKTGDTLAFSHIQVAWNRTPENPFHHVMNGFSGDRLSKYWALLSISAVILGVWHSIRGNYAFAIFTLICTLLPLSTGLWAMPRYILWQAPYLLTLATCLPNRVTRFTMLALSTTGLIYMYIAWFTGKWYVV